MQIITIIPVHNYIEGVRRILAWYRVNVPNIVDSYKIIIVNDNSDSKYDKDFKAFSKIPNLEVINSPKKQKGNLQWSLSQANDYDADLINVIESDAVPCTSSFVKMIEAYKNIIIKHPKTASVSPMYTWKGDYCYPTHSHWHTDGLNTPNGRFVIKDVGKVARVGGAGVPFLFSIWNPTAFKLVNTQGFRTLVNLDSDFGNYVYKKGFEHFRLLECNIEHYEKGKKSR